MRPRPPRIAAILIGLVVRRADRTSVVADLREEFEQMLSEGTPPSEARRWYRLQVAGSLRPCPCAHQDRERPKAQARSRIPDLLLVKILPPEAAGAARACQAQQVGSHRQMRANLAGAPRPCSELGHHLV